MTDPQQPQLFNGEPGTPLRALTSRQMAIYAHLCASADGLTAVELGQLIHGDQLKHHANDICEFCGRDGARALKEKAIRTRIKRGAAGVHRPISLDDWTGREELGAPPPPSAQITELAGDTFEDAFGGGDR